MARFKAGSDWTENIREDARTGKPGLVARLLALPARDDLEAAKALCSPGPDAETRVDHELHRLFDEARDAVGTFRESRGRRSQPPDAVRALAEDLGRRLLDLAGGVPVGRPAGRADGPSSRRRVDHAERKAAVYLEANKIAARRFSKYGALAEACEIVARDAGVKPSTLQRSVRRARELRRKTGAK